MRIINDLNKKNFIETFGNIFEHSNWIAEKLYEEKPFKSFSDLTLKIIKIFDNTSVLNQLKILKNHPDLANKTIISNSLTRESKNEQKSAKLDECTEEEFFEFVDLNFKYKNKFGFPFILSVMNSNKNEILVNFRKRIKYDYSREFQEAIKQVKNIAENRLINLQKNF